jgi:hypothetical protein
MATKTLAVGLQKGTVILCNECEQQMACDRRTQAEPNLTPKSIVTAKDSASQ